MFRIASVAVSLALVFAGSGCSSSPSANNAQPMQSEDFLTLARSLQTRNGVVDHSRWYRSLTDAYPSDSGIGAETEAVVVGNVTRVENGRAFVSFSNPEEGQPDSFEVDWSDPNAMWRTFHLRVNVTSTVAGTETAQQIVVGIVVSGIDVDTATKGLKKLGRIGLFLGHSAVFAYDPNVFSIVGDGALLAIPTGDNYRLPFVAVEEEALFMGEQRLQAELLVK